MADPLPPLALRCPASGTILPLCQCEQECWDEYPDEEGLYDRLDCLNECLEQTSCLRECWTENAPNEEDCQDVSDCRVECGDVFRQEILEGVPYATAQNNQILCRIDCGTCDNTDVCPGECSDEQVACQESNQESYDNCAEAASEAASECVDDLEDTDSAEYDSCLQTWFASKVDCYTNWLNQNRNCIGGSECNNVCAVSEAGAVSACNWQYHNGEANGCIDVCEDDHTDCYLACSAENSACHSICISTLNTCNTNCNTTYDSCFTGCAGNVPCIIACNVARDACFTACSVPYFPCLQECDDAEDECQVECDDAQDECEDSCIDTYQSQVEEGQTCFAEARANGVACRMDCCGSEYSNCISDCYFTEYTFTADCDTLEEEDDIIACRNEIASEGKLCRTACFQTLTRQQKAYNADVFECMTPCHETYETAYYACQDGTEGDSCRNTAISNVAACKTNCCMSKQPGYPENQYVPCALTCYQSYYSAIGYDAGLPEEDYPDKYAAWVAASANLSTCINACKNASPKKWGACTICNYFMQNPWYLPGVFTEGIQSVFLDSLGRQWLDLGCDRGCYEGTDLSGLTEGCLGSCAARPDPIPIPLSSYYGDFYTKY